MGNKVADVDAKMEDVGDKVRCVDEKVQVVIDGARGLSSQRLKPIIIHFSDSTQTRVAAQETQLVIQQAAKGIDEIKCS
jgi:hypothetical protein